jgi:hypothetical protein
VSQNAPNAKTISIATSRALVKPRARLILQDPLAFDQVNQPRLRSSTDLAAEPAAGAGALDREEAREIWENLSLEPHAAAQLQSERKKLQQRAESAAQQATLAKTQVMALQVQLDKERDERLNHPVVYAGALGWIGLGAIWLMGRRRRVQSQQREIQIEITAAQSPSLSLTERELASREINHAARAYVPQRGSTFSLEDSPDLARDFATDLSGLPETAAISDAQEDRSLEQIVGEAKLAASHNVTPNTLTIDLTQPLPQSIHLDVATANTPPEEQQKAVQLALPPEWARTKNFAPERVPSTGLFAESKRVLGNLLLGRTDPSHASALPSNFDAAAPSHLKTGGPSTLLLEHADDAMQMLHDQEVQEAFEQELLAQQLNAGLHAGYDSSRSNYELLSQTHASPQPGQIAMEYLLELRTAVNGLCALGRPEGAVILLEEHLTTDPGTCAWGYLEYMHLCEQIGWREQFESMRERYRQQFNRMAPYWFEPNSHVLGLDGYARAAGELCAAWVQGVAQSHNTISAWLVGPLLGRKLVQLPAYHDLFDLYEMLEFVGMQADLPQLSSTARPHSALALNSDVLLVSPSGIAVAPGADQEFVPTVSLLDLDYEFSVDVILQEKEVQQSEKAVTAVKTGSFSVDFNVAGTQMSALSPVPPDLVKK